MSIWKKLSIGAFIIVLINYASMFYGTAMGQDTSEDAVRTFMVCLFLSTLSWWLAGVIDKLDDKSEGK